MEEQIATGNSLAERGWTKKGTYDEPRLSEVIALCSEIGLEVRKVPFDPAHETQCTACLQASAERFFTVYTRRRETTGSSEDT